MIFRSKVTVDGIEFVVIPTKQGDTFWKKVLTRGLGGKKWQLESVGDRLIRKIHYKNPDAMRRWIASFENSPIYEIWINGKYLNITNKTKPKVDCINCGVCHGCTILDAVHKTGDGKGQDECPISIST